MARKWCKKQNEIIHNNIRQQITAAQQRRTSVTSTGQSKAQEMVARLRAQQRAMRQGGSTPIQLAGVTIVDQTPFQAAVSQLESQSIPVIEEPVMAPIQETFTPVSNEPMTEETVTPATLDEVLDEVVEATPAVGATEEVVEETTEEVVEEDAEEATTEEALEVE